MLICQEQFSLGLCMVLRRGHIYHSSSAVKIPRPGLWNFRTLGLNHDIIFPKTVARTEWCSELQFA